MQSSTATLREKDGSGPNRAFSATRLLRRESADDQDYLPKPLMERRRQIARDVVKAAGLPQFRSLVDQALTMLTAGTSAKHAAALLRRCTKRLPQPDLRSLPQSQ